MAIRSPGVGTVVVERQKLYEQVWSIPGAKLSIQYGISDVGLAKACRRYKIPRPPRGYWARLEAGQKVAKEPLPHVNDPAYEMVIMQGWDLPDETVQRLVTEVKPMRPGLVLEEPAPQAMHALVELTRVQLVAAKPDIEGLVRSDTATALNVRVAPASVDRCMGILDKLIRAWEARGGEINVGVKVSNANHTTVAILGSDAFGIEVIESFDDNKPLTDPQRLTGKLHLFITGEEEQQFRRRWSETKTQRLERMINPLVESLANAIEVKRCKRLDLECVQRQEERARSRRQANASRYTRAFNSRQQLSRDADRWHEARRIREYLDAIDGVLKTGEVKPRDPESFGRWFDWAKAYADSIDPIRQGVVPSEQAEGPTNMSMADLDLTRAAREIIESLNVNDSNELALKSLEEIRRARATGAGALWNEITRVLEGLGYDVAKRQKAEYWW